MTRLKTDGRGRQVAKVLAQGPEGVEEDAADIVVVSCGAVNSAAAGHAVDFWLTSEDLPRPENRVAVDAHGRISLHLREPAASLEAHRRLTAKLKELVKQLDCVPRLFPHRLYMGKRIPIAGVAHQCGTVRFGTDPATSALDLECRAHEVENLYVVDGSFFVSSSAVNPALTIIANALRVGDHLLQRLG